MFWKNTIWYLILGFFSIIELIFILRKSHDRKYLVALFIVLLGFTFVIEIVIFSFLKAYDYYPMVLPYSRLDDGIAGNLFSQFLIVSTALMITVFDLRLIWYIFLVVLICAIEVLFLRLGIFVHYWYRTWMTAFALLIIFLITSKVYRSNWILKNRIRRYLGITFGLFALHMPIVLWIQILAGVVKPSTDLFSDAMNSYALASLINLIVIMIICMIAYFMKMKLLWKAILTVISYIAIYIAAKVGLITIKSGYFFLFSSLDIFGMYFFIYILDKLLPRYSREGYRQQ